MVATMEVLVTGGVMTNGLLFNDGAPENPTGNVHTYVPAPLAVNVVVFGEPLKFCEHNVFVPTILTVGKPITLTCTVAKCVQVFCEPSTEYVVVTVGLAVVLAVLVVVNAVEGVHV